MKNIITFSIISIFLLFIFLVPTSDNTILKLRKELNLTKGAPLIVIKADPRSLTARRFVKKMEGYIEQEDKNLALVLKSTGSRAFQKVTPATHVLVEPLGVSLEPNSFSVYMRDKEPVFKGDVFANPDRVTKQLSRLLGTQKQLDVGDYLEVGINIDATPFFSAIQYLPEEPVSVFILFHNICMGCDSGLTLLGIERLSQRLTNLNFTYLTVTDYSQEQVANFAQNHELSVPIYPTSRVFQEFWQGLGFPLDDHPLDGLVFAISASGHVLFVGNIAEPEPFKGWLKHQSEFFLIKGE